ncbi:MAG: hypothetical protein JWM11_1323, partial [Planctomycetaceae bacterium]|nr:hypothetical protein [Planctomycetaceae bacterium]
KANDQPGAISGRDLGAVNSRDGMGSEIAMIEIFVSHA